MLAELRMRFYFRQTIRSTIFSYRVSSKLKMIRVASNYSPTRKNQHVANRLRVIGLKNSAIGNIAAYDFLSTSIVALVTVWNMNGLYLFR